ncbi:hypothetical protein N7539_001437 [Penicillium diatomitis]|uniref:Uncharacterized protein n=1 Tax=Penicillium diatomitis TaxID=2819901 RepID=A0A9W9XGR3_9EURO|nr:uncharacterized protein N7539_001437 [Penicillium diatomitis]KAJ5492691.1 hypothetical protein N7539_001437 [Penicillium diatomitis]
MDERHIGWHLPPVHHSNHVSPLSARLPDTTLPSDLFPFYQQGSCSDNRRQSPLGERNSIATTPAPRERGDPLSISELINQDSEPRPLAQSLPTTVSRDGHVPPDVENPNTILEPYAQFNPGHAPPAFNQFAYGTIPTITQNLEADLCANFGPSHIPPAFNQFDYATIPTVNQNENLDVGVCASLNLSDIPPTFNQFDYGTIPAINQNENMGVGLCTNFDTDNPTYGNIPWDTQTEGQDVNHPDAVLSVF